MKPKLSAELSMETFGFRADGGARNKPLHDCSNERAAEADECCEDFGRHVIGGEVSQMANVPPQRARAVCGVRLEAVVINFL